MFAINLDITRWTGRAVDADADSGMAVKGAIAIYNPQALQIFNSIRRSTIATLGQYTLKMAGLYVVGEEAMLDALDALPTQRNKWNVALDKFVAAYPRGCKLWLDAHPDQAEYIASRQPAPDEIRKRFAFEWYVYEITPANGAAQRLADKLPQAGMGVLRERLSLLYESAFRNRLPISGKAWNALNRFLQTCEAYSWVSTEAREWAAVIETVLTRKDAGYACAQMRKLLGMDKSDNDTLLREAEQLLAAPTLVNLEDYI